MNEPASTATAKDRLKAWVDNWKVVGPILEEIKQEELRGTTGIPTPEAFAGLMPALVLSHPPSLTSGLVEQQRIFRRWQKW